MTKQSEADKAQGAKTVKMQLAEKPASKAQEQAEVSALKKQVEELQKVLAGQPKSFEERIKFFEAKQAHIKKLQKLDTYRNSTLDLMEELKEVEQEDNFFSENFSLRVIQKQGYSSEKDLLRIHHPALIREVMEFALSKLDNKREELKNLINA